MGKISKSVVLFLSLLSANLNGEVWEKVPVPELPDPVVLRVVYADNPRFHPISQEELNKILAVAKEVTEQHFGISVTFETRPAITIKTLFSYLKPAIKQVRQNEIYDFQNGQGDKEKLYDAFLQAMTESRTPLPEMIAYASSYLIHPPETKTKKAFALSLAETLLHRIGTWASLKAADGASMIDEKGYNEWIYWDSLGYGSLPYDIVITNTPIASVEYYGQDIHTAIRGGLTVGTTTNNNSPLGAFIFWSTFPFIENNPLLKTLRDTDYRDQDALHLCGTYLVHEIGHLLFHYGHPFESDSCIMSPVPMLKFKNWAERLDPKKCRKGHYPAMEKGAAAIYYNRAWN